MPRQPEGGVYARRFAHPWVSRIGLVYGKVHQKVDSKALQRGNLSLQ